MKSSEQWLVDSDQIETPELREDVAEAIRIAKMNIPPYPTELCRELGAFIDNDGKSRWWKQGKPTFSGWVWIVSGCPNGFIPNNVSMSLEEGYLPRGEFNAGDIGYQAFWKARLNTKEQPIVWCAIPSLIHGRVDHGGVIEVGEEKIRIGYRPAEVYDTLRKGWKIVEQMIAEHGEFISGEAV